jgi:hypothetical protein
MWQGWLLSQGSFRLSTTYVRVYLSHKINQHHRAVNHLGDRICCSNQMESRRIMLGAQGVCADVAWRGSSDLQIYVGKRRNRFIRGSIALILSPKLSGDRGTISENRRRHWVVALTKVMAALLGAISRLSSSPNILPSRRFSFQNPT